MFLFRKIVSYTMFVVASASVLGIASVFLLSPGDSWNGSLLISLLASMLIAAFLCVTAWPATPYAPTRDRSPQQAQAPGRTPNEK